MHCASTEVAKASLSNLDCTDDNWLPMFTVSCLVVVWGRRIQAVGKSHIVDHIPWRILIIQELLDQHTNV